MINKLHLLAAIAICALSAPAFADPVKVVAAENFYGDMASQIGGANVAVTSILCQSRRRSAPVRSQPRDGQSAQRRQNRHRQRRRL